MSDPEKEVSAPAGTSRTNSIVQVLTSPQKGFEALAARPAWPLTLLLPVLVGAVATWVLVAHVEPDAFVRGIEEQGRELPPELADNPEKMVRISIIFGVVGVLFVSPLVYFALAGLHLVLLRLFGSEIRYRESLSVTVHGLLPQGILALAAIGVGLMRDSVSPDELEPGALLLSNLGFLADEATSNAVRALLLSADLFTFWGLYLLATGYRIVGRVKAGQAWAAVLIVFGAGLVLKVGLAALG